MKWQMDSEELIDGLETHLCFYDIQILFMRSNLIPEISMTSFFFLC